MNEELKESWVQYAYDDIKEAPVIQTAHSEQEAKEENNLVQDGCVWYKHILKHKKGNEYEVVKVDGPYDFNKKKKKKR